MNTYDITALRGDTFAGLKFSLQSYAEGASTPPAVARKLCLVTTIQGHFARLSESCADG